MVKAIPQEKSYRPKMQKTVFCCGIDSRGSLELLIRARFIVNGTTR